MNSRSMSRSWLLLMGASLALTLCGCGGSQARYASHLERGKHYLAEGNLEKASVEFRNAAQIQPKAAESLYLNGRVAELRHDYRLALGNYQAAVDAQPGMTVALASLARINVLGRAPDRALDLIEPALEKQPNNPDLLLVRAAARLEQDDPVGARQDAEHVVKLAPDNEDAVSMLAAMEQQAGNTDRAISLLRGALEHHPKSVDLRKVLANLEMAAGRPQEAEEQLRAVIALRPQDLSERFSLARFLTRAGRAGEAEHVLQDAVHSQPDSSDAQLMLVDFVASTRSPQEAEKMLRGFIAQHPDDYVLRLGLGDFLKRFGNWQGALDTFAEVAKREESKPQALIARDRMAVIDVEHGRVDVAQSLIGEVLKSNPHDNEALILRSQIALQRQDPRPAIVDLRTVLRDQPNSSNSVRRLLASAFVQNGQPGLAEEQLRAAVEAVPLDAGARIELARLLGQTGRGPLAIQAIQKGILLAPGEASLREALVRAQLNSGDTDAAKKALEDFRSVVPDSPLVPTLAGEIAQAQRLLAESADDYEQALKLQPRNIEPLTLLAKVDIQRGAPQEAVARVRSTLASDPTNPVRINLLAETLIAAKSYPEAIDMLRGLIKSAPTWALPYHNLASAEILAGNTNEAIATHEGALKMIPFEPVLTYELAGLYERSGRAEDAITLCQALYDHSPQEGLAASNLALLLADHRSDRQSLERARSLTASFASSKSPVLLDTYGWVLYKLGDTGEALAALERAKTADPASATTRYHLAMAQLKLGQKSEAQANLEAALAAKTDFRGIADARVALSTLAGNRARG
jgi:tetratricopeptide (TPR) repeat protein